MTDEEMAEEYRKSLKQRLIDEDDFERLGMFDENVEEAFLAGLKTGRPQWHDLRKDPNDLPKKNKSYWVYIDCQGNKIYRSIVWQGCWLGWECIPLAWCEEPTFSEE